MQIDGTVYYANLSLRHYVSRNPILENTSAKTQLREKYLQRFSSAKPVWMQIHSTDLPDMCKESPNQDCVVYLFV